MDERRRGKSVPSRLGAKLIVGEAPKLRVHQWNQPLHAFWRAVVAAWNYDAAAVAEERYLCDAVDIYDLERRMADRTRAVQAGFVAR